MRKILAATCGMMLIGSLPALADCKGEVDEAFGKLRGSKGFRLETKIINEKQGSLTMTVDYLLPDRMHQRVSLGDSTSKMETIAIGDKVWSNQGQGWSEVPPNFAEVISKQLKETVAEPSKSKLEYECLGETSFEGKSFLAYKAKLPAAPEEKVKGDKDQAPEPDNIQTLYVDKASGLPVRNLVTKGDGSDKRLFDGTFSTPSDITINAPG
ncbi:hypothetical protein [Hyphomicrobium sp.]|uniref:hypothetical protein n=1 Tax=Hyphomicrobium sp. TaxID=82 RepID=UPI002E33444B|nr:hypothetical protein [Hyphomicrobium sp.]HEX2842557.1 hypothetical protein [Hyphomicrobium sp.]